MVKYRKALEKEALTKNYTKVISKKRQRQKVLPRNKEVKKYDRWFYQRRLKQLRTVKFFKEDVKTA